MSEPNIVFAPLFPILARTFGRVLHVDTMDGGFVLNLFLVFGAIYFWYLYLLREFGRELGAVGSALLLLAVVTSAGTYSLHAFYSEPMFVFLFGVALWAHSKEEWALVAAASAALGASRTIALPITLVFAGDFVIRTARQRTGVARNLLFAGLCVLGSSAFLLYLWVRFGNPFALLPRLQAASWGRYHADVSLLKAATGAYLVQYSLAAWSRGFAGVLDSRTVNLFCTVLAMTSAVLLALRRPKAIVTWAFASYVLLIYWSNIGTEYLVSCHRFFAVLPPAFFALAELHAALASRNRALARVALGVFGAANVAYGVFMTGAFNRGQWNYF